MSSNVDSIRIEHSSLDIRLGNVLLAAFASLWRRKLLTMAIVATALTLGIMTVFAMPAQYTAVSYIRGVVGGSNTVIKDDINPSKGGPAPIGFGLDVGRVIETQTRLLASDELAHRVVEQLGLERLRPELNENPSLLAKLFGHAANVPAKQVVATKILHSLSVTSDPRAYLITVRYTDRDRQLAVLITNAFVAEFLRSAKIQTLSQQRYFAQAILSKQLSRFGDKHPRVAEARLLLAATDDLLKEQLNQAPEAVLQAAGENVTEARAAVPSSPKSFVIGLFLLVGLCVGFGVALWLERDRWWVASQYHVRPSA